MFSNSNLLISGGNFYANQGSKGIELLREHVAPGAFHNSDERYNPPKCHPRTRLAVLEAIMAWIKDGQKTSFIMWLHGPAGAGKSAIAQTIAEMLFESGVLAASFFWSRSASDRNNEKRLVATLAYQLLLAIPKIRIHVEAALERDPTLFDRSLEAQMESLVVEPLAEAFHRGEGLAEIAKPKLIILDGLDECGTPEAQQYILKVISAASLRFPISLVFLITSRPEQEIRDIFNSRTLLTITQRLALDDSYHPDEDIRLFLSESFSSLKEGHTLRSLLPSIWPTMGDIDILVEKSSGQFIYAATAVKFVSSSRHRPDERLKIIFGIAVTGNYTPFAELDALYRHIFSSVQDLPLALEILSCIFLIDIPEHHLSSTEIEDLLSFQRGDLQLVLSDLHSVLYVPDVTEVEHELRIIHASLQDFLLDPQRSGIFHIDESKAHSRIAQCFLRRVNYLTDSTDKAVNMVDQTALHDFVYHSLKSHPSKALFQAFLLLDLEKWVSLSLEILHPKIVSSCVLLLSAWFRKQESNFKEYFDTGRSLYAHHASSLNTVISNVLGLSTRLDTAVGRNLITAITHPQICHTSPWSVAEVLASDGRNREEIDHLLMLMATNTEHILEIQQFLRERDRTDGLFVHGGMYASLSTQVAHYIFEFGQSQSEAEALVGEYKKMERKEAMKWATESLPFYLSNADYISELAEYLINVNASTPHSNITSAFQDAIDRYLNLKRRPQASARESRKRKEISAEVPRKRRR